MATKAKKKQKMSNVGLKASKFNPLKIKVRLSKNKRLNVISLAAVGLILAGFGGFVIYQSQAAVTPSNAEIYHTYHVNQLRKSLKLNTVQAAGCLTTRARSWSIQMAKDGHISHHLGKHGEALWANDIEAACGKGWRWLGENVASVGASCKAEVDSPCFDATWKSFLKSSEHLANMTKKDDGPRSPAPNYVGVGSYLSSNGYLYVTQEFAYYPSLGTYKIHAWSLKPNVTVTTRGAENTKANPGDSVLWNETITNNGPVGANVSWHINGYHWVGGRLVSSNVGVKSGIHTFAPGKKWGGPDNDRVTIPRGAKRGEKYCRILWVDQASGPNSDPATSGDKNTNCITVN